MTHISQSTETLLSMLETRRPAGSKSERRFIFEHLIPLGLTADMAGNLSKRIGDAPVLWSCHTDTVHRQGGKQKLAVKGSTLTLSKDADSNCLGADDSAGIWLMREMILAERPGLYVFHRAEECGGIGSRHIATTTPEFLTGIDYAIALDRRGNDDVITHQGWGRCCSDKFAGELASRLGNGYQPDDSGIFTDTANYVDLVPECTNLSVGYRSEHTKNESLDLDHLFTLRDSLINLDTTGLPVMRDPTVADYSYGDWTDAFDTQPVWERDLPRAKWNTTTMIRDNPGTVAEILQDYGISDDELADEIYRRDGYVKF